MVALLAEAEAVQLALLPQEHLPLAPYKVIQAEQVTTGASEAEAEAQVAPEFLVLVAEQVEQAVHSTALHVPQGAREAHRLLRMFNLPRKALIQVMAELGAGGQPVEQVGLVWSLYGIQQHLIREDLAARLPLMAQTLFTHLQVVERLLFPQ
jgi:hypothetical protein